MLWSFRLSPNMSPSETPKLASSLKERDPICLKIRLGHPIRAYSARALKCRSVVSEDFVERSSPFEVTNSKISALEFVLEFQCVH